MKKLPVLPSDQLNETQRQRLAADLAAMNVGDVRFDRHNRMLYSTDASLYQVEPIGVVLPTGIEQVQRVINYCTSNSLAILPRGGGTSLAGQCTNRAVVIDLSPWQRVISIEASSRQCTVEPGIAIDSLNAHLAEKKTGLFFAPDPATSAQATIGGCISNNAAGARSIRYGRTSENVAAVDLILASGDPAKFTAASADAHARRLAGQVCAVVRQHAAEIRQRYPKTLRRNAGYGLDLILKQLDSGVADEDVDLCGLICGSEGTLAVIAGATLKLHPLPLGRAMAIASFDTLEAAIEAVGPAVATGACAVELLDDSVLEAAMTNIQARRYVDLLPKVAGHLPRSALYVEYQAEQSLDEFDERFAALRRILPNSGIEFYRQAAEMAQAWTLRKSSEALLHALSATRKPITFVEDSAIPLEKLSEYVASFKQIVARHGTIAAYYAHASVGVLHIRPMLNLHEEADRQAMREIAVESADLARSCGGVMSGEHGDGRVRGPLLERFYGPVLMGAFGQIKEIFDPRKLLNPGMIVDAGPVENITAHLRTGTPDLDDVETYFDYSDQENLRGAVEMCNGAGFCRKNVGGTMCPSYRATLDERHSTRGRGNALRLAIGGQLGGDGPLWNDPATIQTLDLCLSCKACKSECPSNVDISRLKAEYTAQRLAAGSHLPLRDLIFANIRTINRLASLAPAVVNWINSRKVVRGIVNRALGLAKQRSLPEFRRSLFRQFSPIAEANGAMRVVVFGDCFTAYNEPAIGLAAINVLVKLGYRADLANAGCCGRSMISMGLLPKAIATADRTLGRLREAIEDPRVKAIVVCEPSCLSAMKDDWLSLKLRTPISIRRALAEKAMLVEDFVERFWEEHPRRPSAAPFSRQVILHGHCHQKSLWGDQTSAAPLRRFAGANLKVLPSGCCGMAGAFGFTADHYQLSMKIGQLSLFGAVQAADATAVIAAPGTSCRHQIRDGTTRRAVHPIEIIAEVLQADAPDGSK